MDIQTAVNLVTQTFEAPFDAARFRAFARNLLNSIDEAKAFGPYQGAYIWEAFRDHVHQYWRVGTYTDPHGDKIDVLIVRLKQASALERARTMQRNFVARYLKERDAKDAALVATYTDDAPDWRFSLVKMEYQVEVGETGLKVKEVLTPARRYSFLVGANEPNHTAQQQLVPLLRETRHNPTLAQLEAAFNIEPVTREFFEKYKVLFLDLKEELDALVGTTPAIQAEFDRAGIDTANFAKKLLGQLVFLTFLQKKGWLGVAPGAPWGSGPQDFLRQLFAGAYVRYENFFDEVLEPLFYEALAIERPDHHDPRLDCRIPFLNGGLFEPVGNYDWRGVAIPLSNARFDAIFDTFDLYNFTVREDEPFEKEVAVDPEMLGKVFENLLDVEDRKSKGAFYTPREIVHYMCQESLINYLDTTLNPTPLNPPVDGGTSTPLFPPACGGTEGGNVGGGTEGGCGGTEGGIPREDLETFIRQGELGLEHDATTAAKPHETADYSFTLPAAIREHAAALDAALAKIKICDPAIGSGAFPVGMMHEIVRARTVLTAYLTPPSNSLPARRGTSTPPSNSLPELRGTSTPPSNSLPARREGEPPPPVDGGIEGGCGGIEGGWQTSPELWHKLKPLARQMRRDPTPAEQKLWQHVRRKQLDGYKFRRQHAIGRFIVDFYCRQAQLVIEVDGPIHDYTAEQDAIRQEFLESRNLRVLRFRNEAVLHDIDSVLAEIRRATPPSTPPTPPASKGAYPPPACGGNEGGRTPYALKRHAIHHSLYGVDIDPGAVDIAKLRLWLSLVVDEQSYDDIQPLPNLDYKIVCGNALLGFPEKWQSPATEKVERLKRAYFSETNPARKATLRAQIDAAMQRHLANAEEVIGYPVDFDFRLFFSEVFHAQGGFDVVIGNPPYVSHDKIAGKRHLKHIYESYEPFADLYCYFIEKAITIQNALGTVCFITSNSYMKSEYGKPLRKFISRNNDVVSLVNVEDFQLFETAIVNSAILLSQSKRAGRQSKAWVVSEIYEGETSFEEFVSRNRFEYPQAEFSNEYWLLVSPDLLSLKRKIEGAGETLESLDAKIRLGLATGANYAFLIDEEQRQQLLARDKKSSEIIKPIIRGRNIFRYRYEWAGLYILLTKNGVDVKSDYPAVYTYLDSFGDRLKKRGAKGKHWTNLRACSFFDDFKREKIIWIELTDRGRFTLSSDEIYLLNTAYFMLPPTGYPAKYLLGILNSKIIQFYLSLTAETSGMGTARWIKNYVKKFPIPQPADPALIETRVQRILDAKAADPAADVSALEADIDRRVYQLYGLTPEEIAIIEDATGA